LRRAGALATRTGRSRASGRRGQSVLFYRANEPTIVEGAAIVASVVKPAERAARLRVEIAAHNEAYHVLDAPTIPDADYDARFANFAPLRPSIPN